MGIGLAVLLTGGGGVTAVHAGTLPGVVSERQGREAKPHGAVW